MPAMTDKKLQIEHVLQTYTQQHPQADVEVKLHDNWAIRVRIVDPDFGGKDRVDREAEIWPLLESLPDDVYTDITMLLLLAPEEQEASLANLEFDDPTPSRQ